MPNPYPQAFIDVTDSAGLSRTRINPHTLVHWLGLDLPVKENVT